MGFRLVGGCELVRVLCVHVLRIVCVCVCVACVRKLATALWIWQCPFFCRARVGVRRVVRALRWSERRFKCLLGSRGEGGACGVCTIVL